MSGFDPNDFEQNPNLFQYETPYWEPIGQFIIAFGVLEARVDNCIGALLIVENRQAQDVTSQIKNFSSRISLVQQLTHRLTKRESKYRAQIKEITVELRKLNTYRNSLVHGPWGSFTEYHDGETESHWSKIRLDGNDFKYKQFHIRLSELKTNTNLVTITCVKMVNLISSVVKEHLERHEHVPWFDKPSRLPPKEGQNLD
jgi:hypothetical protein